MQSTCTATHMRTWPTMEAASSSFGEKTSTTDSRACVCRQEVRVVVLEMCEKCEVAVAGPVPCF